MAIIVIRVRAVLPNLRMKDTLASRWTLDDC